MINWGIIGFSNIGERFAESLKYEKEGKLVAVAGIDGEKIKNYKELNDNILIYESYEELLKNKDIHAVYIALPNEMHLKYTIRALNLKKAVLCEKPGALSSKDMERIIKCAKRNKVFYMEGVETPFIPMISVIKKVLNDKVIGDVTEVYACFSNKEKVMENLFSTAVYPLSFILQIIDYNPIVHIDTNIKKEIINNIELDTHFDSIINFGNNIKAHIEGGIDINKEPVAIIKGTLGKMFVKLFYKPESYIIELNDGRSYEENIKILNDDMYGVIHEVHKCIEDNCIESSKQSLEFSMKTLEIIETLKNNK